MDYLAPVFSNDAFVHLEVPNDFEMCRKHYFFFSGFRKRKDTSGRKDTASCDGAVLHL